MKIGIIGNGANDRPSATPTVQALIRSLQQAGQAPIHFDPSEGSDEENPGYRALNRGRWRQKIYRQRKEVEILHCHHLNWADMAWCATTARALGLPTVASVGEALTATKLSSREKKSAEVAIEAITCFIADDKPTANHLIELGCPPENLRYRHEFRPTGGDNGPRTPVGVSDFINRASFLLVATGPVCFYKTQEQSGFDLVIEALAVLKRQGVEAQLLAIVEDGEHMTPQARQHRELLDIRVPQAKLTGQVHWCAGEQVSLQTVLSRAQGFVRPTNRSEDPLVLRRALQTGVPCIASDAAERPDGCRLFRNRNALDLARAITGLIEEAATAPSDRDPPPLLSLLGLYEKLLSP